GEGGARHTDHQDADQAAGDTLGAEGAADDAGEGRGDLTQVGEDDHDAGQDVDAAHERHQGGGHPADRLDPADDYGAHEGGDDEAGDQRTGGRGQETGAVGVKDGDRLGVGLVGLEHVAAADAEEEDRDGEQAGEEDPDELREAAERDRQIGERAAGDA